MFSGICCRLELVIKWKTPAYSAAVASPERAATVMPVEILISGDSRNRGPCLCVSLLDQWWCDVECVRGCRRQTDVGGLELDDLVPRTGPLSCLVGALTLQGSQWAWMSPGPPGKPLPLDPGLRVRPTSVHSPQHCTTL